MNWAEPSVAATTGSKPLSLSLSSLSLLLVLLRRWLGYSAARSSCADEAWSAARTYWTSPDRIRIGATLISTAVPLGPEPHAHRKKEREKRKR